MLSIYKVKLVNDGLEYTVTEDAVIKVLGDRISQHLLHLEDVTEVLVHTDDMGDVIVRKVIEV